MPRNRLTFRQRDITAALKAAKAAGVSVARIEVKQDGFVIIPGEPGSPDDHDGERRFIEKLRKFRHEQTAKSRVKARS